MLTQVFVTLLIVRNALRHKLRTLLTIVGIVVAIVAFGLLRTVVDAWYAGANASSCLASEESATSLGGSPGLRGFSTERMAFPTAFSQARMTSRTENPRSLPRLKLSKPA